MENADVSITRGALNKFFSRSPHIFYAVNQTKCDVFLTTFTADKKPTWSDSQLQSGREYVTSAFVYAIHRFAVVDVCLSIFYPEWIETQADILEEEGIMTDGVVNRKAAVAHAQEKFMDYQGVRPNSSLLSMPANERTVRTCLCDVCCAICCNCVIFMSRDPETC